MTGMEARRRGGNNIRGECTNHRETHMYIASKKEMQEKEEEGRRSGMHNWVILFP